MLPLLRLRLRLPRGGCAQHSCEAATWGQLLDEVESAAGTAGCGLRAGYPPTLLALGARDDPLAPALRSGETIIVVAPAPADGTAGSPAAAAAGVSPAASSDGRASVASETLPAAAPAAAAVGASPAASSDRRAFAVDLTASDDDDDANANEGGDGGGATDASSQEAASAALAMRLQAEEDARHGQQAHEAASAALAKRLQTEDDAMHGQPHHKRHASNVYAAAAAAGAAAGGRPPAPRNKLGLSFGRCEILRRLPSPVVLFRAVGAEGTLEAEASRLVSFAEKGSARRCGAAENTGSNGKNCSDTYVVLADTDNDDAPGKRVLGGSELQRWKQNVVDPTMQAATQALHADAGGGDADGAAATLLDFGLHFTDSSVRTSELRVLKYSARRRAGASEAAISTFSSQHILFTVVTLWVRSVLKNDCCQNTFTATTIMGFTAGSCSPVSAHRATSM